MNNNPFDNALLQLEKAAKVKNFSKEFIIKLQQPDRDIRISIPVEMDDGSTKIFEGYRVEYNNALGPYKGGIRFHLETEINEVKALALWMTLKCAIAGIPMGGGKGGITVDLKKLSKSELEKLSRGWVQKLADVLGPKKDVPAPDVNTTSEIMDWMADEFEKITEDKTKAAFTGKSVEKGGSEGRNTSTAEGAFYVFEAFREKLNLSKSCTVAIQGFGNAGSFAGLIFSRAGHKVIAISDSKGGIYNENGIDIEKLREHKKISGSLAGFSGSKNITNEELLATKCDLLIPAAFNDQINESNANNVKAKVVLELANGPTTPEADDILFKKNIPVVPDILVNAGGVIVSYFEWEQNLKGEHWTEKEVFDRLKKIMEKEANNVFSTSQKINTDLRKAAFIIALERISKKMGYN